MVKLKGFNLLRPDDQPKIKRFTKTEEEKPTEDQEKSVDKHDQNVENEGKKKYAKDLWELKDKIETSNITTGQLKEVLQLNDQPDKGGRDLLVTRVADGILRGAIPTVSCILVITFKRILCRSALSVRMESSP